MKVRCGLCQGVFESTPYYIKKLLAGGCRCKKRKPRDLVGQKFGRLRVVAISDQKARRDNACWVCICDCGRSCVESHEVLLKGQECSCGCRKAGRTRTDTHISVATRPEYGVWASMLQRATNPNDAGFPAYGARGIGVSESWRKFENFIADMGPRPSAKHSIDRIDNDAGYSAKNCRWATSREQQNNRRVTRTLTYQGRTQSIAAWADETGIPYARLASRIKRGYRPEQCLNPAHPLPRGRNH
jgi:hypothetical protein